MIKWFKNRTKSLWSNINKIYENTIKKWLSFGGVVLGLFLTWFFNGFGFVVDLISVTSDTATTEQVTQLGSAFSGLAEAQNKGFEDLSASLETKLNCKNLNDDWIVENSLSVDNQYILLKDGVEAGSVRFYKAFKDTFVLKFSFIPDAVQGTNGIFSIKDDNSNELRISLADDVSESDQDNDLDYFSAILVSADGTELDLNSGMSSQILPTAKSGEEILLQIQTQQKADSLNASAFIVYTPAKKINEKSSLNLIDTDIPNFINKSVRLNMGVRKVKEANPGIKVVDCEIQQIS